MTKRKPKPKGKYRVVGPTDVYGSAPGELVEPPEARVDALIAGGHIALATDAPAPDEGDNA